MNVQGFLFPFFITEPTAIMNNKEVVPFSFKIIL